MAAEDLILKVDASAFDARVSMLEGYVSNLRNIAQQYETKKAEVDSFYSDPSVTEEYKAAIQANIDQVNKAIINTEEQIKVIKDLIEKKQYITQEVSGKVAEAKNEADKLFS